MLELQLVNAMPWPFGPVRCVCAGGDEWSVTPVASVLCAGARETGVKVTM